MTIVMYVLAALKMFSSAIDRHRRTILSGYLVTLLLLTLYPFSFNSKNAFTFIPHRGISFTASSTAYTETGPTLEPTTGRFSVQFKVIPQADFSNQIGTICTNSIVSDKPNFCVIQVQSYLLVKIWKGTENRGFDFYVDSVFQKGKETVCRIVYDGEMLRVSINGVKKREDRIGKFDHSRWNKNYP
jgi:hypothetical protein